MKPCIKNATRDAVKLANDITPSVIVLARVVGITPVTLAKALFEAEANDEYRALVAEKSIKPAIEQEKERAKNA